MRRSGILLAVLLLLPPVLLANSCPSCWAGQEESEEGPHPLRLIAYIVHPVGYVLHHLVVRPLEKVFSAKPLRKVFGYKEEPMSSEEPQPGSAEEPAGEPTAGPRDVGTDVPQGQII